MTAATHRDIALATTVSIAIAHFAIARTVSTEFMGTFLIPVLWIPLSIIGGLLPDIDKKNTTAHRFFKKYRFVFYLVIGASLLVLPWHVVVIFLLSFLFFELLILKSKHRRETHSLLFLFLLTGVLFLFSTLFSVVHVEAQVVVFNILFGIVVGALTHDIADMYNVRKIHFLYPIELILSRFLLPSLGNVIAGTPAENLFRIRWIIACIGVCALMVAKLLLPYLGVDYVLETNMVIVLAAIIVAAVMWKLVIKAIRMIFVIGFALVILWFIIQKIAPTFQLLT